MRSGDSVVDLTERRNGRIPEIKEHENSINIRAFEQASSGDAMNFLRVYRMQTRERAQLKIRKSKTSFEIKMFARTLKVSSRFQLKGSENLLIHSRARLRQMEADGTRTKIAFLSLRKLPFLHNSHVRLKWKYIFSLISRFRLSRDKRFLDESRCCSQFFRPSFNPNRPVRSVYSSLTHPELFFCISSN